jgi:thioredoxin-related protein
MKYCLSILLLIFTYSMSAQVEFKKLSLASAINEAARAGKIVFVQFETDKCEHCNEVAEKGLSAKELRDVVNKKSVPIKITVAHPDRERFISMYNPQGAFGTFFISADGELIHSYLATSTRSAEYINQLDKALATLTEGKVTLKELELEWNTNPTNVYAMEANLQKRSALGLATDSLLEIYCSRIPADSFRSLRTINFVVNLAPNLFSKANFLMRKDRELFGQNWYAIALPVRVYLNNKIAYKSMDIAIKEKDVNKAMSVASFHAATHENRHSKAASQTYNKRMLDYYVGVKDTTQYLHQAIRYYDNYVMSESLEQLHLRDSLARNKAIANAPTTGEQQAGNKKVVQKTYRYTPVTQSYTRSLNEGAWLIYTSTSDSSMLAKALGWAERANKAFVTPDAMDTYARLLYKTGNRQQAIEWETKAIAFIKQRQFNYQAYEQVLAKMNKGVAVD